MFNRDTDAVRQYHEYDDNEKFVVNPTAFGGTEQMGLYVKYNILPNLPKFDNYRCIILPGMFNYPVWLEEDKKWIIWLHNYLDQFSNDKIDFFKSKEVKDKLKYLIVVTETHKNVMIEKYEFEPEKIVVIPNAFEPLKYNPDKWKNFDKPELIHISTAERGMPTLIRALNYIDDDFTLRVFNDFNPDLYDGKFGTDLEFINGMNDPRVIFYNRTPRNTVRKYIEQSHIHAYPCQYKETFCLSQIEAMSAGDLCVYFDIYDSALNEVSNGFGIKEKITYDKMGRLSQGYALMLKNGIKQIRNGDFDPTEQIKYANETYNWDVVGAKWKEFHDTKL